jgi:hypothetical protein
MDTDPETLARRICALEVKHRRGRPWDALSDEQRASRIKQAAGLQRNYALAGAPPSRGIK